MAPPEEHIPWMSSNFSQLQVLHMLFPQLGMPFPSLIPGPILLHLEEAQSWCCLLISAFSAYRKSPATLCTNFPTPQYGDNVSGSGGSGIVRLESTEASSIAGPGWTHRASCSRPSRKLHDSVLLLWSLAPAIAKAAVASPFDRWETESLKVSNFPWPLKPGKDRGRPQILIPPFRVCTCQQ